MTKCSGSVASIESAGMTDGPGIRTVVFLNGCTLRCKFCHNPEMQNSQPQNMTVEEVVQKILKNRPYFGKKGGVTFSGGEPLLQYPFLLEICKRLKQENIHTALDTAGIGFDDYKKILKNIDLVLLDIKHITPEGYEDITSKAYLDRFFLFVDSLNQSNKPVWIRQVIVPGVHDNQTYIKNLADFLHKHIKNVERVDFLPYHKLGQEKYLKLGLDYPYENKPAMNPRKCEQLHKQFLKIFEKTNA